MKRISFADSRVSDFSFSVEQKVMKLSFNHFIADGKECHERFELRVFAKKALVVDVSRHSLVGHDRRIGVVAMVLGVEQRGDAVIFEVMTVDDGYLQITFDGAEPALKVGEGEWENVSPSSIQA